MRNWMGGKQKQTPSSGTNPGTPGALGGGKSPSQPPGGPGGTYEESEGAQGLPEELPEDFFWTGYGDY
jgi:hypothetical protein